MRIKGMVVSALAIACLAAAPAFAEEPQDPDAAALANPAAVPEPPQAQAVDADAVQLSQSAAVPESSQTQAVDPDAVQLSRAAAVPQASQTEAAAKSPSLLAMPDSNSEIFYKNKLELSTEVGVLPFNTPMLVGPIFGYSLHRPRKRWAAFYTLVPAIVALRWQLYDPRGPSFLRGNTELTFGANFTGITEGRESMFTGPIGGVRYNFIQPDWRLVPYLDLRVGLGYTDANGPWEVAHHLRDDGKGRISPSHL